jgi:hypothetical protein
MLLGLMMLAGGCSSALVGTWKTDPVPEGESFVITNATFKDDSTYTASARQGDQNIRLAGTYEFDGFGLKLKTPGKPERTYGATYNMMMKTLELRSGDKKQVMKKQ